MSVFIIQQQCRFLPQLEMCVRAAVTCLCVHASWAVSTQYYFSEQWSGIHALSPPQNQLLAQASHQPSPYHLCKEDTIQI